MKKQIIRKRIAFMCITLFCILSVASCASYPIVKHVIPEKMPLRAAVIIDIENEVAKSSVRKMSKISKNYLGWDVKLKTGKMVKDQLKNFYKSVFQSCDFYYSGNIDRSEYDLIIKTSMTSSINGTIDIAEDGWRYDRYTSSLEFQTTFLSNTNEIIEILNTKGNEVHTACIASVWSEEREFKKSFKKSISGTLYQLVNQINESSKLNDYAQLVSTKGMPNPDLITTIRYSEEDSINKNNMIDAGEVSSVIVEISNKGGGPAYEVIVKMETENKDILFEKVISLGEIKPGKVKEIIIPIKANLELETDIATFVINTMEKRGYDAKKVVLNVPTLKLEKPIIDISNYKINDGKTGLASGNGNGIPENGEIIELIAFVKNSGVGPAYQVKTAIDSINNDLAITHDSMVIPTIMPGKTAMAKLAFSIPPTFSDDSIEVNLSAKDVRGASDASQQYALSTEISRPSLAYTYKLLDRSGQEISSVRNGEDGHIEIIPLNNGKLNAREVQISLGSQEVNISSPQARIDCISASSQWVPLRFAFAVPRTLEKESVDLKIEIKQKDFAGRTDTINIPIRIVVPDFEISHQILDPNGNGIIEQGETVDLIVRVKNTGGLDADNVVLSMNCSQEGIVVPGAKKFTLGMLAADAMSDPQRITMHVQRRAKIGDLPISFAIEQKEFKGKSLPVALSIAPEKAEVITVAGKVNALGSSQVAFSSANSPPVIAIATPKDNRRVASANEMLAGTVVDDQGVASIEVMINGQKLDATRGIAVALKPGQSDKERDFRINVPLKAGRNEITVTALDIENLASSKTITIYRESARGEIWAVVIGLNQYQNSSIPRLKYAKNDAQAFARYLRDNMGIEKDHIFELYDSDATLRQIRSILGTSLRKCADKPEDTVYIFLAGHGAPEEDSLSKDGDGITKYVLGYDSDPADFYSTALPMDEIARIFSRLRAERVIFIADSCYSGSSGGRTILAEGRRANISDAFLDRLAQGKGRIILTSSSANETSQESDKIGHGYFTHCLIEGLNGAADLDGDKLIDADEIYRYLNQWVPKRTNGAQHPVKKGQAEGQVIVGRVM